MKFLLVAITLLALVGCTPLPRTDIRVVDANGRPMAGVPLAIELSSGLRGHDSSHLLPAEGASKLELRTNAKGVARVEYTFTEKQPSEWRSTLFKAKRVEDQWIEITPLRDLPKGSSITVGIPNP